MKRLALASLLLLSGCAHSPAEAPSFEVRVVDRPDLQAFEVTFVSTSPHQMCLTTHSWPKPGGGMESDGDITEITVGGTTFPAVTRTVEECHERACDMRVRPGATVTGQVNYRNFDMPAELYRNSKQIKFRPVPFYCRG